jgi:hypothetical protein
MPAQADQPSFNGEKAPESKINLTPPLEQRQEYATSTQTEQTNNTVRVQDNNLVVPPLFTNLPTDGTPVSGLPPYLSLTNPYDSWGVDIAGRKWTDVAQALPPEADTRLATAAPAPDRGAITREQIAADSQTATVAPIADQRLAINDTPAVTDRALNTQALGANDVHNKKILDTAKDLVGQKVWQGSQFERAAGKGKYGGAASVSHILQGLGYDYAGSASVSQLTNKMIANGWQLVGVNDAKPGDIIFGGKTGTDWRAGGGNGRVGIVGEDGKVYANKSETGRWTASDKQQVFGKEFGDQVWILRPPAEGPQGRPVERQPAADTNVGRRRRQDQGRGYQQENPNYRDYRDFRGRDNWQGRDDGRYPPQYGDSNSTGFLPFDILKNAIDGLGQALWSLTPFKHSVRGGRLGCAASVSEVLQRSGYRYANHAGVGGLESQLMRNGWRKAPLSAAAPGDVVVVGRSRGWRAGGGSAHVGIVGENGSVYHNSSSRGQWIKDNLQARFGRGMETFVLKPPANGRHQIDPRIFANLNPEPEVNPVPRSQRWGHPGRQQDYGREDYGRDYGRHNRRAQYENRGGQDRGYENQYDRQRYAQNDYQRYDRDEQEDYGRRGRDRMPRAMREIAERLMRDATERRERQHHRRHRGRRW